MADGAASSTNAAMSNPPATWHAAPPESMPLITSAARRLVEESNTGVADRLSLQLSALQERQDALVRKLSSKTGENQTLLDDIAAVFDQVPEYARKLRNIQQQMDALAARTANMHARCVQLTAACDKGGS